MINSLDFVLYANRNPSAQKSIIEAIENHKGMELIIDRHKLTFVPNSQYVIVDKAQADGFSVAKIIKCKLPYATLLKLLDGQWDALTGLEWL